MSEKSAAYECRIQSRHIAALPDMSNSALGKTRRALLHLQEGYARHEISRFAIREREYLHCGTRLLAGITYSSSKPYMLRLMSKFERLEHTLARELSSAVRELQDPRIPIVVTVERVKLSPDGRQARVLVSALSPDDVEGMLAALNGAAGYLQQAVARDLALKFTPKLHFYTDALKVL